MRLVVLVAALAVVAGLGVTACGESTDSSPAAPTGGAVATVKGAEMYATFCAGCHGADGSGGPGGPAVTGESDATEVAAVVRDGSGSMPGFADQMSEDQITAVSQYLVDRLK
jgi:mono/diheme cytochrome c family protein